jgi:hypothetical protein
VSVDCRRVQPSPSALFAMSSELKSRRSRRRQSIDDAAISPSRRSSPVPVLPHDRVASPSLPLTAAAAQNQPSEAIFPELVPLPQSSSSEESVVIESIIPRLRRTPPPPSPSLTSLRRAAAATSSTSSLDDENRQTPSPGPFPFQARRSLSGASASASLNIRLISLSTC